MAQNDSRMSRDMSGGFTIPGNPPQSNRSGNDLGSNK